MALFIPTIITQGIYSGFIGTVSTVTIKACTTISYLSYYENPDVKKILDELDIQYRLHIIKAVLNKFNIESSYKLVMAPLDDLEKTQVFNIINENKVNTDPIKLCLDHLYSTIRKIDRILLQINNKIIKHNDKWFSTWRHLNLEPFVSELKLNSNLLETRFKNFMLITEFINKLER